MGFPGSSAGKESASSAEDPGSTPGPGRSPWRRDRPPTLVFLDFPGGSDGKESPLQCGRHRFDSWRILQTEKSGRGYSPLGSQRVRDQRATQHKHKENSKIRI